MPHILVDTLKNGEKVRVFYTLSGNPKGIPVVYLHGGPGDPSQPLYKKQFDLKLYRLLLFDQRGCGKSEPLNHTEKNTTQHLLADIEKLRKMMKAEKWVVTGGSWGSALALLYAIQRPTRVLGLIIRGVFDLDLDNSVMKSVYPEDDAKLRKLVRAKRSKDFLTKTSEILKDKKNGTRKNIIQLLNKPEPLHVFGKPKQDSFKTQETLAILGIHYEMNRFFVSRNSIYDGLYRIQHIPLIMVEGRYDIVTPMKMAYSLSKRLPHADLRVVPSGHAFDEPATLSALYKASKDMANKVHEQ